MMCVSFHDEMNIQDAKDAEKRGEVYPAGHYVVSLEKSIDTKTRRHKVGENGDLRPWWPCQAINPTGEPFERVKKHQRCVIPAKAGIQNTNAAPQPPHWIPAFAQFVKPRQTVGMTQRSRLVERTGVLRRHFFTSSLSLSVFTVCQAPTNCCSNDTSYYYPSESCFLAKILFAFSEFFAVKTIWTCPFGCGYAPL